MLIPYFIAKLGRNYYHDKILNNNAYVKKYRINVEDIKDIEVYLYKNSDREG